MTGKSIYREKLPRAAGAKSGEPCYASVVLVKDRLYAVSRAGDTCVLPAKPAFEVLAQNPLSSGTSDFNASPAISDGKILLRSNRFLYCIADDH
jgi:hypothetical protein